MLPTDFEGRNFTIKKPGNMPDKDFDIQEIPAQFGVDSKNYVFVLTAWSPSKEDLDALRDGRPLFIKMFSDQILPFQVFTKDVIGNPNQ